MFGFGSLVAALCLQPGLGAEPQPVQPIVGGAEAGPCEFPSAVAILEADDTPVMCSGTLVHPSVVTLAAHCVNPERPIVGIGFGEQGQGEVGPARTVAVEDCVGHPQYFESGYPDVAYCTLAQPVLDVPIVPVLAGCELDLLEPGGEVTIVGYGASYGSVVSGEVEAEGVGPKRHTTQTIDEVLPGMDEVHMVGPDGSQSACFGDSGGPALLQAPDGTWRVFGAASRLYDPGGFPPPQLADNFCGVGVTYGLLTTQLPWLEAETGYDLTPCHDGEGAWQGGCGDFPMSPGVGFGTWDEGCAGGPVGGGEPLCEPAMGTSTGGDESTGAPPDDGSSSGGSTSEGLDAGTGLDSGEGPDSTIGAVGDGSTSAPVDTPEPEPEPEPEPGSGSAEGSSGGAAASEPDAAGCGCRGGGPGAPLGLGLGLLALVRRRG